MDHSVTEDAQIPARFWGLEWGAEDFVEHAIGLPFVAEGDMIGG